MKSEKRDRSNPTSVEELLIKIGFKEEIEENNIFLIATLTYFFGVLYACLTQQVEIYFGTILILTAIMMVWYVRDLRKDIKRKYEERIKSLQKETA